ncbi:papain-like cysteine protease family protein [Pyxidicoccus xibeiensis]|uniref:papain-like cysteine protease family protein n=1 Tax=Pyxidicoccus xibeiensis TaxID=2906759 RepID=UPI0020A7E596|nr:papain-like cysteine protease family protein [Pyxidicoccus xibeiensis]MCP3135982.1 hypothetical protein [Pyxidicoccus xibeiensis]
MAQYKASKRKWYEEKFLLPWPAENGDAKASLVVEEIGQVAGLDVHLTVFKSTWTYRFQHHHGLETIFDRIFGSGTGGVHVTLELPGEGGQPSTQGIHCYIGGPNQGRTDEERVALEALLEEQVTRLKGIIQTALNEFDEFVWEGCDDPDDAFAFLACDTRHDGFELLARIMSARHGMKVVYPAQSDLALLWATPSLHPMQALQNCHQRLIRDSVRGLGTDEASAKESVEMGKYFYFTATPPKAMGLAKDAPADTPTLLEELESTLDKLERELPTLPKEAAPPHLEKVNEQLWSLRKAFDKKASEADAATAVELKKRAKWYPLLADAERQLKGFKKQMEAAALDAEPAEKLEEVRARLARAQRNLSLAHAGMCSIQNFHTIEPFYLFRLLVKFQVQSKTPIPPADRTKLSSSLTGGLHNSPHMAWLFTWLRDRLVVLDAALRKACPKKGPVSKQWPDGEPAVVFYLKGGRAAKYLQDRATEGENDWDTNIVINPNLKAGDWYRTFLAVHNTVLAFLEESKRLFAVRVHQRDAYEGMTKALTALDKAEQDQRAKDQEKARAKKDEHEAQLMPDLQEDDVHVSDEDERLYEQAVKQLKALALSDRLRNEETGSLLEELEKENLKAELIDIGIPRRDTVEAFEQWFNVCPRVIVRGDVPIPGHLYYLAEFVTMIREAFMDKSISIRKIPIRVERLLEVLLMASADLDRLIGEEKEHVPQMLAPSLAEVGKLPLHLKRLLTLLVKQLADAYELAEDPGLAKCFDTTFKAALPQRAAKAKYPKSLTDSIAAYAPYGSNAKNKEVADAIGFVQWMAETYGTHLKEERARFIQEQRKWFVHFIKAIYTGSIFALGEDLQVQFAVSGAFAAQLHAKYARFERLEELEPVKRVDIKLFCTPGTKPGATVDAAAVLELIEPIISTYLQNTATKAPHYHVVRGAPGTLYFQWPEAVKFAEGMEYQPIVMKLSVEACEESWPQLAFIQGLPVLGLRDLIWEYKRRAGHVEETFTQRSLKTAIDALMDILTRFESPSSEEAWSPTQPAVVESEVSPDDDDKDDADAEELPWTTVEVPRLDFIPQQKANWCWAATSLMMRKFYLKDTSTLEDVVREVHPGLEDEQSSLRLARLKPQGQVEGRILSWEEIKAQLDAKKPFIIARGGHYWACYGYQERRAEKRLLYWDPLPPETGAKSQMTYAQYQAHMLAGGATAQAFEIQPWKVLIPLQIDEKSYQQGSQKMYLRPVQNRLRVASSELRVRHARNSVGGVGAVIQTLRFRGLPAEFEWDMKVAEEHWAVDTQRMSVVLEVEATLSQEQRPVLAGTTQLSVGIEKPS